MARAKHDICPKCNCSYAAHKCERCGECKKYLSSAASLKRHIENVHQEQELKFKCKICGKGFSMKSVRKTHERTVCIDKSLRPMEKRKRAIESMLESLGMSFQFSPHFS